MTDNNLTDDLEYSSFGINISKPDNQFNISALSKQYILFISEYIRNQKHLTDYISIAKFIQKFMQNNKIQENEKIIKRSENIIAAFKDATSLLICNKKQISILFLNKYLASLIYQNYFKFYSIFKINDFCVGSNFNELAEYIWNNPYDTDEIYEYIQKNLKDQKFTSIDFTEKTLKIPDFDNIDILVCKILSGINFTYPCVDEKLIYITVSEVTKEGKN